MKHRRVEDGEVFDAHARGDLIVNDRTAEVPYRTSVEMFDIISTTCYHAAMGKAGHHLVKDRPQLAALASGVRQEIVDVLPRLGTVSVAELAQALDRPPDALYYHIRALASVGLIVHSGYGRKGRRQEALYRAVAPQLELRIEPRTPAREKAATAIVASMMRMGIRDYRRSIKREDVVASGPDRDLWALRTTGWLSPTQIKKVVRSIQRLLADVSQPKGPGRLYSLTLSFAPLHQRGRERKRHV